MKTKVHQKLLFALAMSMYIVPGHAQTWYTNASLDFTSITSVRHGSQFIADIAFFTIIGTAFGSSVGIQGIYASQDQIVMQRCLALAEQFNLSRTTGTSPLLRIQVEPDPTNAEFARIQYCTLYG